MPEFAGEIFISTLSQDQTSDALVNYHQQIMADCVDMLYRNLVVLFIEHLCIASVLVAMFWGLVDSVLLLSWFFLIFIICMAQVIALVKYRRSSPVVDQAPHWGKLFSILTGIAGVLWGLGGIMLFIPDSPAHMALVVLCLVGLVSTVIVTYSNILPVYYAFSFPVLVPAILYLLFTDWDNQYFTIFLVFSAFIFAIMLFMLRYSRNNHREVEERIALRYERLGMIEDLKIQRARAEKANQDKSRFLAAASHDLRQPLHALGLFVDQLKHRNRQSEDEQLINEIESSTSALKNLLDGLLDISRLDARVTQINISNFSLQTLFERIKIQFSPLAAHMGLTLRVVNTRMIVQSDVSLLERVLGNLVFNAITYTRHGGIVIGCRRRAGEAVIQVTDSGIGIADDEQDKIYQEFYQVDNSERDRKKGLGLGLAIVSRLVQLLGHRLTLMSIPGKGSTFRIAIPISKVGIQPVIQESQGQMSLDGAFVIIIDDEAPIISGMTKMLEQWGCQVLTAESESEASSLLAKEGQLPDAIVADYRLRNNKTGIDAIKRLRRELESDVPAIIITGDTSPDRLKEAAAQGFDLLHKPVEAGMIRFALSNILQKESGTL